MKPAYFRQMTDVGMLLWLSNWLLDASVDSRERGECLARAANSGFLPAIVDLGLRQIWALVLRNRRKAV
jgi:hypothetical protein